MLRLFLLLVACLLASSCGDPARQWRQPAGTIGGPDHRDADLNLEKDKYFATARAYIAAARAGDADKALALTSPITIKNKGRAGVEKHIRTELIPAFAGASVRWLDDKAKNATDDTGNRCFVIPGEAKGRRSFDFIVTVGKEDGQFRVVTATAVRFVR